MAEKEVRKTTTKRVVRRTTTKTVPAKTTARQAGVTSVRKAPSRVTPPSKVHTSSKGLIVGIAIFIILLGASIGIGVSDKGQLNVENVIALRKQNATPEEKVSLETVPVQQSKSAAPNGGLVGMGQAELPPAPVVETSTSTDASSTPPSETEKAGAETSGATESTSSAEESTPTESAPVTETTPDAPVQ